jgi:mono/diheme cytochrome c family protein
MIDFVSLLVLVGLTVLFGFLAYRAWGAKNKPVKWAGVIVAGLLTLVFGLVLAVVAFGTFKLNQNYNVSNPVVAVKVAGTPEQLARGKQLINSCGCHGENLGGIDFAGEAGMPLGVLYAPNLTPGGHLQNWSDGEIVRAIREGVHQSGRSLLIMPSYSFRNMSDEDVHAVVAYLRGVPPVTPDTPPNNLNALGAALIATLFGSAQTVQPHIAQPVIAPPKGVTAEYGKYLVSFVGCGDCHGQNLAGIKVSQGPPPGPNITTVLPNWSEQDFLNLMRKGTLPDGKRVTENMPWQEYDKLASDDDLKAMYLYLHSLAPLPDNPQ